MLLPPDRRNIRIRRKVGDRIPTGFGLLTVVAGQGAGDGAELPGHHLVAVGKVGSGQIGMEGLHHAFPDDGGP